MPNYRTSTGLALGAGGPMHMPTLFRPEGLGVSLHPLQRAGVVAFNSHAMLPNLPAAGGPDIQGGRRHPAAHYDMPLPPVLYASGSARDPRFMV